MDHFKITASRTSKRESGARVELYMCKGLISDKEGNSIKCVILDSSYESVDVYLVKGAFVEFEENRIFYDYSTFIFKLKQVFLDNQTIVLFNNDIIRWNRENEDIEIDHSEFIVKTHLILFLFRIKSMYDYSRFYSSR